MATKLQAQVGEFLKSLGLGAAGDGGLLVVGDAEIVIEEDPFGRHVIVSAVAGALSADAQRRGRQVGEILRLHLGSILDFRAIVTMDPEANDRVVVATSVLEGADMRDRLRVAVEDVATLTRRYRPVLDEGGARGRAADFAEPGLDDLRAAMIFRP